MKIQYLGCVGSSRHIDVSVDGDGSGRLLFYILDKKGQSELLPTPEFKNLGEREEYLDNLRQDIGE